MLLAIVWTLVLPSVAVGLVVQALREEYLLILNWPERETLLLERSAGERYHLISPPRVPFALVRFARLRAADGFAWLWHRVRHGSVSPKVASPLTPL